MKTNTSAASQKATLLSVKYETTLSGMWSRKMNSRLRPRKKSRRRSRSVAATISLSVGRALARQLAGEGAHIVGHGCALAARRRSFAPHGGIGHHAIHARD